MKKIIFLICITISQSVFAISGNTLAACKNGARSYSSYAVWLNQYIQKALNDNKNMNSNQLNELNKFIRKSHDEYKNGAENNHYKASEILHSKKQESPEDIEVWRNIMDLSVDWAYLIALAEFNKGNLNSKQEYYERKIYDKCIDEMR